MNWEEAHKIINADKKHDRQNKEADKWLIWNWETFKQIKGNKMGDIRRNTAKNIGVVPSFLAISYRDDVNGIERYVNKKYVVPLQE